MGYLNENGLARYDGLVKQWVTLKSGTVDGVDPLLNWQKTETAGAVTCCPLPAAPIDPVANFAFTETGPASGTKGPDNPSTITGVSSVKVTRCGKNIVPYPFFDTTKTSSGITWTDNGDGTVTANGTASASSIFVFISASTRQVLKAGVRYTVSGCPQGGSVSTYYMRFGVGTSHDDFGNGASWTATTADESRGLVARIASGATVSNLTFKPQIELGTTATSFEPYSGNDYTIQLGDTYYGGSVDLSSGVMTVTWGEYVFTGTENWSLDALSDSINSFKADILPAGTFANGISASTRACSHFPLDNTASPVVNTFTTWASSNARVFFRVPASTYPDVVAFKSWLASEHASEHPVVFAYLRNHPATIQLTPTQIYSLSQPDPYTPRVNTVYSDQQSVQVGYPKSPLATSTELTNAIISLGSNL